MPPNLLTLMQPAIVSVTSNLPSDTAFRELVNRRDRSGSHRRGQNVALLPVSEAESNVTRMTRYPVSIVFKTVAETSALHFSLQVSESGEQSRVRLSGRGNQHAIEIANQNAPTNTRIHHAGSRQPTPSALTTQQLGYVIRRCNILCGVRMDTAATGLEGPNVSGVALVSVGFQSSRKSAHLECSSTSLKI